MIRIYVVKILLINFCRIDKNLNLNDSMPNTDKDLVAEYMNYYNIL